MVRILTETEKWNKPWFYNAGVIAKLLFIYICEQSDRAGFWKPNFKQAADTIGVNIEMIEAAFGEIKHQFIQDGNWVWIPDFLYHQGNLPLCSHKNAHKGIIRLLRQHIDGFQGQVRKLLQHYDIPFEETLWHSDGIAMASGKGKGIGKSIGKSKHLEQRNEKFEQFWSAYPKKVGKVVARRAFKKINPSEQLLQRMLSAIEQQKKSKDWQKERGQYIPYPATWLNGERWNDELIRKENQFGTDKNKRQFATTSNIGEEISAS
jgi:hypothetical protein